LASWGRAEAQPHKTSINYAI